MPDASTRITVRLFATFRKGRFIESEESYPGGTTIGDIIAGLGIESKEVGIILLNGRRAEPDRVLEEGAQLALFPLLGGG